MPTASTAPGDPTISQRPLTQTARIKPAFIMALDNSGSMSSDETLCKTSVGVCYWNNATRSFFDAAGVALETGTGYAKVMDSGAPRPDMFGASRDPEYNRAYFDPAEAYPPWIGYDGTLEPDSPINAAKEDPGGPGRPGPGTVFDFTSKLQTTFRFTSGTTLYVGTEYFNNALCNNSPTPGIGPVTNSWITLAANLTFTGTCDVTFRYWPAVVYLSAAAPPPTGFTVANRVQINGAGPAAQSLQYEISGQFANGAD